MLQSFLITLQASSCHNSHQCHHWILWGPCSWRHGDTGAKTNIWAPRESGGTSGDLWVRCDANPCSLLRPWSETLEHDECGQHAGTCCCLAWIVWSDTLDLGKFSSVSVPFQIPMTITTASLTGLILGSLAIFPQVFNVIESHPGGGSVKEGVVLWTSVLPVVLLPVVFQKPPGGCQKSAKVRAKYTIKTYREKAPRNPQWASKVLQPGWPCQKQEVELSTKKLWWWFLIELTPAGFW